MEKINIVEYIQTKKRNNPFRLQNVQIDLTNLCNANCPFCLQGTHNSNIGCLSTQKIKEVLLDDKKLGAFSVGFDGGEICLREDASEIISYASSLGFNISITTNGHLLTDQIINAILRGTVSRVTVSFHSADKDIYNILFGVTGDEFDKAIQNITLMKRLGINVGLAVTITKYNYKGLNKIINFARSLGITENNIGFNQLIPGKTQIADLCLTLDEKLEVANYMKNNCLKACLRDHFLCDAGRTSLHIAYNGLVYACPLLDVIAGNVNLTSISEIWENSDYFIMLRSLKPEHFKKCYYCPTKTRCQMCLRNNIVYCKDIFTPFEDTCSFMKAAAQK